MSGMGGGEARWRRRGSQAVGWLVLVGLIGLLVAFRASNARPPVGAPGYGQAGDITVYFTRPQADKSEAAAPMDALDRAVGQAASSIDLAAYELDLQPMAEALLAAADREVLVRIVAESDQAADGSLSQLEASGVPIVLDGRPSLMHDKFMVVDHTDVWTGSMNFTRHGVFDNNNNLVHLHSAAASDLYTHEFDEMFVQDRFSALSLEDPDRLPLAIAGGRVEIYFAPDDHPAQAVTAAVASARDQIEFLAFSFTSSAIAQALAERVQAGVNVRGVMEADQVNSLGSQYDPLRNAGVDVRLDGNPGLLHDKVIIIDRSIVITGSYNFSLSAETTNDENLVVIRSKAVAEWFEDEFERLYADALP